MPERNTDQNCAGISALCALDRRSFAIAISDITPDGCSCEAPADWDGECDFLHLTIADKIEINGRLLWQKGRHAGIAFFGQIHPQIVEQLARKAA